MGWNEKPEDYQKQGSEQSIQSLAWIRMMMLQRLPQCGEALLILVLLFAEMQIRRGQLV